MVSPLRLFDELIRIRKGDVKAYVRARRMAWGWLDAHQLNPKSPTYDDWSGYFEDVPKDQSNVNQAAPTYTALYLLNLRDPAGLDPQWKAQVSHLIAWVDQHFGVGPFDGATGINEQGPASGGNYLCCSLSGLGSDTARWAAVNALYYEKTGDHPGQRGCIPITQLRDLLCRLRRRGLVLRAELRSHPVLVQRRLFGLPPQLQLGDGCNPRSRSRWPESPVGFDIGGSTGHLRS